MFVSSIIHMYLVYHEPDGAGPHSKVSLRGPYGGRHNDTAV